MTLFLGSLICGAYAHGRMTYPPSRNHLASNEHDKNALFGKGRCGSGAGTWAKKHYDQQATEQFAVMETFSPGQTVTVSVAIQSNANHVGKHWFEYACMDGHVNLPTGKASVQWQKLAFQDGRTETDKSGSYSCQSGSQFLSGGTCKLSVVLPSNACNHGVLNWNWNAEHNTPNEHYKNCADIKIGGGGSTTNRRPAVPSSQPVTPRPNPTTSGSDPIPSSPNPTLSRPNPTPSRPNPTPSRPNPTPSRPQPTPSRPLPTHQSTNGGTCKGFPRQCEAWKILCTGPLYATIKSTCQGYCECLKGTARSAEAEGGNSGAVIAMVIAFCVVAAAALAGSIFVRRRTKNHVVTLPKRKE